MPAMGSPRALTVAALLALTVASTACRGRRDPDLPETIPAGAALALGPVWTPPDDWASMPLYEFEALVLAELPEDVVTPFPPATYDALADALDAMDETSVRAAVLLGRSRTDRAGEVISRRLFQRELGPDRNSDAGDVIAAAALARFPDPARYWRLLRLVEGKWAHPDLEVRVECAVTALRVGFDRAIPFLLGVLRIGTWEGLADRRDYTPAATTAWARTRAAEALSLRAGVPCTYRADAPIAEREREARALADLLADVAANAPIVDPRLMGR